MKNHYKSKVTLKLVFIPSGKEVVLTHKDTILEGSKSIGIDVGAQCNGNGKCGKCKIKIEEPHYDRKHIGHTSDLTNIELSLLTQKEISNGIRLACQTFLTGDLKVSIPSKINQESKDIPWVKLKTDSESINWEEEIILNSGIRKYHINLSKPVESKKQSYFDIIIDAIGISNLNPSLAFLKDLSYFINQEIKDITVVVYNNQLLGVERGNTEKNIYGVAVDVGTTTLAVYLLDINTGEQLGCTAKLNSQTAFGSDVLSRINYARTSIELNKLQHHVIADINEMIEKLCKEASINKKHIYKIVLVGNTCMAHLLLGLYPFGLGRKPFSPVINRAVYAKAGDLKLNINMEGVIIFLPHIYGFVGSDALAMTFICGLKESEEYILALDIGTNTEIVMGNKDKILSCSTAAGPAFEGGNIRCGMIASPGAIAKVIIENDLKFKTIGGQIPKGICGSGLIDLVAELLKIGVIDTKGRLLKSEEVPIEISEDIRRRIIEDSGTCFILSDSYKSKEENLVYITQKDIRELQLAQGSIAAGITILLKEFNIDINEISKIYLAGTFGNSISIENSMRIGLIPCVPRDRVLFIGNAAGEGAKKVLLYDYFVEQMDNLRDQISYLELSTHKEFLDAFVEAMKFPAKFIP